MPIKKQLVILLAAIVFCSCTMIQEFISPAQSEFDKGMALFNAGRYQEAVPRFQRATELDQNFGQAYLYLGRSYLNLKSWRQALTPLRTAYRLAPEDTKSAVLDVLVDALLNVGLEALTSGDFLGAIGSFREVLQLQPASSRGRGELARALIGHGGALLAQGNVTQAISSYGEAVKLAPTSLEAIFGLAKAYFRNGEFSRAFGAAEDAMKLSPGNRDIQSLMQELRKR